MNKHNTKTALLLAAVMAASFTAVAAETNTTKAAVKPSTNPMELFNEVVAQGQGVKVTRAQLDEQVINLKAAAVARGQNLPPERMKMLEQQVLGRLIGMQILNNVAIEADRTNGLAVATKRFEMIRESAGTEEAFARQLKTVGMTADGGLWSCGSPLDGDSTGRFYSDEWLPRSSRPRLVMRLGGAEGQ